MGVNNAFNIIFKLGSISSLILSLILGSILGFNIGFQYWVQYWVQYWSGGDTAHTFLMVDDGGDTAHTFFDLGNNWGGEKSYTGRGDTATHILCLLEDFGGDTAQQKAPS